MKTITLTTQQIEDVLYCIEGHIITCEEFNQNDEFDIRVEPFKELRESILRQVQNDRN